MQETIPLGPCTIHSLPLGVTKSYYEALQIPEWAEKPPFALILK